MMQNQMFAELTSEEAATVNGASCYRPRYNSYYRPSYNNYYPSYYPSSYGNYGYGQGGYTSVVQTTNVNFSHYED